MAEPNAGASIDLSNPNVLKLLGKSPIGVPDSGKRELVQVAGDVPDPTMNTGHRGVQRTMRLNRTAFAHPRIWYRDHVITTDAYQIEGEPLKIHLICPKCRNYLMIPADKKKIDLNVDVPPAESLVKSIMMETPEATYLERAAAIQGGRLSIEPFECTWENKEAGPHRSGPGIVGSGVTLCRWSVAVENNVARDV